MTDQCLCAMRLQRLSAIQLSRLVEASTCSSSEESCITSSRDVDANSLLHSRERTSRILASHLVVDGVDEVVLELVVELVLDILVLAHLVLDLLAQLLANLLVDGSEKVLLQCTSSLSHASITAWLAPEDT